MDRVQRRHHLRDPHLTELGREQCRQLRSTFPHHDEISIVMASPLLRTIQTASFCLGPALIKPEVPFLLIPTAQEIANQPCDIGYPPEELKPMVREMLSKEDLEFDAGKIDFSLVEEGWNSKVCFPLSLSLSQFRSSSFGLFLYNYTSCKKSVY